MSVKSVQIFACILVAVLAWGAQSSFLLLVQKHLGTWKAMYFYGLGQVTTAGVVAWLGCKYGGELPRNLTWIGVRYGVLAGATACIGGAGLTLAFKFAAQSGNNLGSTWISPLSGGLLQISYIGWAYLLLPAPKNGWGQIFHPGYMLGVLFIIVGVALVTYYRPS